MAQGDNLGTAMKRIKEAVTLERVILVLMPLTVLVLAISIWNSGTAIQRTVPVVHWTFLANAVIAMVALEIEIVRKPFSFAQIHWLFYLAFLVIAPWSQYLSDYRCWGYKATTNGLLTANMLLLAWAVLFLTVTVVPLKPHERGRHADHAKPKHVGGTEVLTFSTATYVVFAVLALACFAALSLSVGFGNLFSKATVGLDGDNTKQLVVGVVFRSVPLFVFLFSCFKAMKTPKWWWIFVAVACGGIFVFTNFPTALARAVAAATYGGLMITFIPALRKKNGLFSYILLLGLVIVFPAINVFRKESFSLRVAMKALHDTITGIPTGFNWEDFDAYSMFMRSIDYVAEQGSTKGFELLSSMLFFVPRALWPGKLHGSGTIIGEYKHLPWTRLSDPLPGEGMMNFGFAGVFVFAILAAAICRFLDNSYHDMKFAGLTPFYPFAAVFFFIVMRGELMSALSVTIGYTVMYCFLLYFGKFVDWISVLIGRQLRRKKGDNS